MARLLTLRRVYPDNKTEANIEALFASNMHGHTYGGTAACVREFIIPAALCHREAYISELF